MSTKGSRQIIVNEFNYYWKFNEKVFVGAHDNKGALLIVDFGWYDIWLYVNDKENEPEEFFPKQVTPNFVKQSIIFAIANNWKEQKLEIFYKDGSFHLKK